MSITHRRAMELLSQAQIFFPAIVPSLTAGGGYIVFSAMKVLGHGPTIEDALENAKERGFLEDVPPFPPFRGDGKNIMRLGEVVAVASSRTMADRIANALNLYHPNERRI